MEVVLEELQVVVELEVGLVSISTIPASHSSSSSYHSTTTAHRYLYISPCCIVHNIDTVLNANSSKMVTATDLKLNMHVSGDSLDRIP